MQINDAARRFEHLIARIRTREERHRPIGAALALDALLLRGLGTGWDHR